MNEILFLAEKKKYVDYARKNGIRYLKLLIEALDGFSREAAEQAYEIVAVELHKKARIKWG
ncbi:MAG: hypothetical protein JST21_00860 [Bacteroidetes bacterium]|nr:hypothetical protein [Bacteroidota bacterium]